MMKQALKSHPELCGLKKTPKNPDASIAETKCISTSEQQHHQKVIYFCFVFSRRVGILYSCTLSFLYSYFSARGKSKTFIADMSHDLPRTV